jgi:lipoprotein-anchoring transpeptidase ErfK/SrfK
MVPLMTRKEWLLILILAVFTVFSMAFAPAPSGPPMHEGVAAVLSTATATASATATAAATMTATSTPSVTPSVTATPTATHTPTLTPTPTATLTPTATPYPFDTRADLPRYIYIDQETQWMYVFEHGQLVRDMPCSTGLPEHDTTTEAWSGTVGGYWGTFTSFGVFADDAWYLYPSLGSILVHSLPYTLEDDEKVYQGAEDLGVRPSSHGCIRISPEDATWLTAWNPEGAYCTITDPFTEKWRTLLYSQP